MIKTHTLMGVSNYNWEQPLAIKYTSDGEEIIDPNYSPSQSPQVNNPTFTVTDFNDNSTDPSYQGIHHTDNAFRVNSSTFIGGASEAYQKMINDGNRVYFVNSAEEYAFEKVIRERESISIASLLQYGAISVLKLHKRGFTIGNDDRDHGEATPVSILQREQGNKEINYIQPQNISWSTKTSSSPNTYISNGVPFEQQTTRPY